MLVSGDVCHMIHIVVNISVAGGAVTALQMYAAWCFFNHTRNSGREMRRSLELLKSNCSQRS